MLCRGHTAKPEELGELPSYGTQVGDGGQGARQADKEPEARWSELGTEAGTFVESRP